MRNKAIIHSSKLGSLLGCRSWNSWSSSWVAYGLVFYIHTEILKVPERHIVIHKCLKHAGCVYFGESGNKLHLRGEGILLKLKSTQWFLSSYLKAPLNVEATFGS
jgi:hypothetical protein